MQGGAATRHLPEVLEKCLRRCSSGGILGLAYMPGWIDGRDKKGKCVLQGLIVIHSSRVRLSLSRQTCSDCHVTMLYQKVLKQACMAISCARSFVNLPEPQSASEDQQSHGCFRKSAVQVLGYLLTACICHWKPCEPVIAVPWRRAVLISLAGPHLERFPGPAFLLVVSR